jgi:Zn-dependent membrane protease YugP
MAISGIELIFVIGAVAIAMVMGDRPKTVVAEAGTTPSTCGLTGAEVARRLLDAHGLHSVPIQGEAEDLGDHYDTQTKSVHLSSLVIHARTVLAIGVAAHEVGHAVQDATNDPALRITGTICSLSRRTRTVVRSASIPLIGTFTNMRVMRAMSIAVERDASDRALEMLKSEGLVSDAESLAIKDVLDVGVLSYVTRMLRPF